jgi:hypothetical protein
MSKLVAALDIVIERLAKLVPGNLHDKLKASTAVGVIVIAFQGALQALDGAHLPGLAGGAIALLAAVIAGYRKSTA